MSKARAKVLSKLVDFMTTLPDKPEPKQQAPSQNAKSAEKGAC